MDLNEYQAKALRTAGPDCKGSLAYSMGGVGGEAGEYIDVVKKHLFHGKPYGDSKEKAAAELGDLLWGIAQAADAWGLTLSEVAEGNVAKLLRRYPQGFSAEAAAARVDQRGPSGCLWIPGGGVGDPQCSVALSTGEVFCPYHRAQADLGNFEAGPVPGDKR